MKMEMKAQLSHKAWMKMKAYVDLCEFEISGLGKVEIIDGDMVVTDVAIFEQTVSAAHSDISGASLAKFQTELIKKGESPKAWFLWWHSHAKMSTFFSGTDTSTIDSSTDFPMMLSIVTNHQHEFSARFDLYRPLRMTQILKVEILEEEDDETTEACRKEIAKKVSVPEIKNVGFHQPSFKHSQREDDDLPRAQTKDMPRGSEAAYKEDYGNYLDELKKLYNDLTDAIQDKDIEKIHYCREEIYDKKIDGYHSGFEKTYPIRFNHDKR